MPNGTMSYIQSVVNKNNPSIKIAELNVVGTNMQQLCGSWTDCITQNLNTLTVAAESVGHIRYNSGGTLNDAGTGFMVAPGYIMTNRHVAELFANIGAKTIHQNSAPQITFDNDGRAAVSIRNIEGVTLSASDVAGLHLYGNDLVILALDQNLAAVDPPAMCFDLTQGGVGIIAALGFPTNFDPKKAGKRWIDENQKAVFGQAPEKPEKRISPYEVLSTDHLHNGLQHGCSVLKGSSGSPLVDILTGKVLAVHFLGAMDAGNEWNRAIPAFALRELLLKLKTVSPGTPDFIGAGKKMVQRVQSVPPASQAGFGVLKDTDDFRDVPYRPTLEALKSSWQLPKVWPRKVLDQKNYASCTGHALVHLLAILNRTSSPAAMLSPRMAYEMARLHDDIPGRNTKGSSLRGVIKGFFHNGLARADADGRWDRPWNLNMKTAMQARSHSLGAYYRLAPNITDYHAALNEVGAVLVSARIHKGWEAPELHKGAKRGVISKPKDKALQGHAFVIVGYDKTGFIVLNSAGPEWGQWMGCNGRAHWSYEDWAENVIDGWVLRPAVSAPNIFGKQVKSSVPTAWPLPLPRRSEILGHLLIAEKGKLADFGRSAMSLSATRQTATLFKKPSKGKPQKYSHLLFFAHAETTSEEDAQRWTQATKAFFKSNGIYAVGLQCDPEHATAFRDLYASVWRETSLRLAPDASGFSILFEQIMARFGPSLWLSYRQSQQLATQANSEFFKAVTLLAGRALVAGMKVHLAGQLAGCQLLLDILNTVVAAKQTPQLATVQLIAAAMDWSDHQALAAHVLGGKARAEMFEFTNRRSQRSNSGATWLHLLENSIAMYQTPGHTKESRFMTGFDEIAAILPAYENRSTTLFSDLTTQKVDETNAIWDQNLLKHLAKNILKAEPTMVLDKLPWPPSIIEASK